MIGQESLVPETNIPEVTYVALGGISVGEQGWGKSSFSGMMDCVNARGAVQGGELVAVEASDSKVPEEGRPALTFSPQAWTNFTQNL